jgi:hypothetical protein
MAKRGFYESARARCICRLVEDPPVEAVPSRLFCGSLNKKPNQTTSLSFFEGIPRLHNRPVASRGVPEPARARCICRPVEAPPGGRRGHHPGPLPGAPTGGLCAAGQPGMHRSCTFTRSCGVQNCLQNSMKTEEYCWWSLSNSEAFSRV